MTALTGFTMFPPLDEITKSIDGDLAKIEDHLLHQLLTELQQKTPISTGHARAGWQINGYDIINNVPYIGYLETGTWKMKPHAMVATTLNDVDPMIGSIINSI